MSKDLDYSSRELMAIILSRDLKDGEVGHIGTASEIPFASCQLAKKLHAPNIELIVGAYLNPKPGTLYPAMDQRNIRGAEAILSSYDTISRTERGLDFMFYSGIQIDKYGNFNLNLIGDDLNKPKFRGPGIPNAGFAVTFKRFYLYHLNHAKRTFVEKVDFISGAGNIDAPDGRRKIGISTQGPALCVTPLAVMDFEKKSGRMRLKSIHEGVSLDHVLQNTGFELILPEQIATTSPPTKEELKILRSEVDTRGILRK